jgi:hypothetical protein
MKLKLLILMLLLICLANQVKIISLGEDKSIDLDNNILYHVIPTGTIPIKTLTVQQEAEKETFEIVINEFKDLIKNNQIEIVYYKGISNEVINALNEHMKSSDYKLNANNNSDEQTSSFINTWTCIHSHYPIRSYINDEEEVTLTRESGSDSAIFKTPHGEKTLKNILINRPHGSESYMIGFYISNITALTKSFKKEEAYKIFRFVGMYYTDSIPNGIVNIVKDSQKKSMKFRKH